MFKVNNKDTRTYFTPCSSVSAVNFEHVTADWETQMNFVSKGLCSSKLNSLTSDNLT